MDPLKKSHKIKQIIRIKVTSIPSQAIHISKYFHPQSFFIYALSLLTIICLQGCEKKENPLMIYKDKCQNDLNVVGEAIHQIKRTGSTSSIKEENYSKDNLILSGSDDGVRLKSESHLWGINSVLILMDNSLNVSRLDGVRFVDSQLKKAAAQCELSILEKKQNFLSDVEIYSTIEQLDLSESLVTTQHFYNKLLARFRRYGAGKKEQDRQKVQQYQKTLATFEIGQRSCDADKSVTSCLEISEKINNTRNKLSSVLGYPNPSMNILDQTMALNKDSVFEFLKNTEDRLRHFDGEITTKKTEINLLHYNHFRDGLFEAVATLLSIEFLPVNKTTDTDNKKMLSNIYGYIAKSYDVIKDGKIVGHLEIDTLDPLNGNINNQFYPIKKGIKGSHASDDQLPEGVIILALVGEDKTETQEQLITVDTANDFVRLLGEYLADLSSGEQEWILNSGIPVENDFKHVPGYVFQQWLYRPKLIKKILAKNKDINAEKYLHQVNEIDFLAIKRQLLTAKLRIVYLSLNSDMSVSEKEQAIKNTLPNIFEDFSLKFSSDEAYNFIQRALTCYSFCYEPLWSKMIAMDIMTAINQWSELDDVMVNRYIEKILMPGASRTAEDGVSDFLGRSYTDQAFFDYLSSHVAD